MLKMLSPETESCFVKRQFNQIEHILLAGSFMMNDSKSHYLKVLPLGILLVTKKNVKKKSGAIVLKISRSWVLIEGGNELASENLIFLFKIHQIIISLVY